MAYYWRTRQTAVAFRDKWTEIFGQGKSVQPVLDFLIYKSIMLCMSIFEHLTFVGQHIIHFFFFFWLSIDYLNI